MSQEIFWAANEQKFVQSLYTQATVSRYDFVLRDTLPITLRVVSAQAVQGQPWVAGAVDAGRSILFGAKTLSGYATETTFLFSQATWTASGSSTSTIYSADINLNTEALINALGSASYLDCKVEFTLLNGANHELSTQVTWRISPDVISGSEGISAAAYLPIAQAIDENGNQIVRIVDGSGTLVGVWKNGAPYTYIASTGLWYPLTASIVDNVPVPAFGAGENF